MDDDDRFRHQRPRACELTTQLTRLGHGESERPGSGRGGLRSASGAAGWRKPRAHAAARGAVRPKHPLASQPDVGACRRYGRYCGHRRRRARAGRMLTTIGTITARGKIAELEVAHRQKLEDAHLQAAREHTSTIYIPLNATLSTLADAYLVLREQTPADAGQAASQDVDAFQAAVEVFLSESRAIVGAGQDAFLSADLDARLRDFSAFPRQRGRGRCERWGRRRRPPGDLRLTLPRVPRGRGRALRAVASASRVEAAVSVKPARALAWDDRGRRAAVDLAAASRGTSERTRTAARTSQPGRSELSGRQPARGCRRCC